MNHLKRLFTLSLLSFLFTLSASAQFGGLTFQKGTPDAVILRDGTIIQAKIQMVGKDKTVYAVGRNKNMTQMEVDNSAVFMLHFEERGTIVFDARGERILTTSTTPQYPKGAVLLFLCNGQIMPVYNLSIDQNVARYYLDKKGEGRKGFLAKCDIFMVCYPDGTRDIITSLTQPQVQPSADNDALADEPYSNGGDNDSDNEENDMPAPQTLQRVTLVLTNGAKLNVWLVKEERLKVSYKKENTPQASTFVMQKSRIRSIVR